ncbi:hypothetical protein ACRALDRAFT_2019243 [Sodiomyces alcalophilus JCM 7366]|uniref:uncharacterized protein n=1 Tax=Sodiomyces alcalophilus JCM 7366 TaxID=591952 RepID=UPI0039B3EB5E
MTIYISTSPKKGVRWEESNRVTSYHSVHLGLHLFSLAVYSRVHPSLNRRLSQPLLITKTLECLLNTEKKNLGQVAVKTTRRVKAPYSYFTHSTNLGNQPGNRSRRKAPASSPWSRSIFSPSALQVEQIPILPHLTFSSTKRSSSPSNYKMGTPFITMQEPTRLDYIPGQPPDRQPPNVPKCFLDAMQVRTAVFVHEQKVPLENEFDRDDPRSCHWVVYASVSEVVQEERRDDQGNIVQPRRRSTRSVPAGTIRLVPFPHEPHPIPNAVYWDGKLTGRLADDGTTVIPEPRDPATWPINAPSRTHLTYTDRIPRMMRRDRATSLHDGREVYVKLGRLAVLPEFRGNALSRLLVRQAISWLRAHPTYFNPSAAELASHGISHHCDPQKPYWNGLICVHAQETVVPVWERCGFRVDEGMGRWMEEGIWHVGMFLRLNLKKGE